MKFQIKTRLGREVVDITSQIQSKLPSDAQGAVMVTVLHTTAAITTADLDEGTDLDLLDFLDSLVPQRLWRHSHDPSHAPDHLLASLVGPSVMVPVDQGQLVLGQWQRIVLIELDGPKQRDVVVRLLHAPRLSSLA